ncbi:hydroxylamine reductase [Edaphobacter aggregans]|uniref:hydroxylamine reductase n=1 Tax=Edaphobacter aggregans TaxID=570835 RepID=UPI000551896B|nr:hydroxylamine reductase [Edaphobacter aggregans]
MFCFQCEQTGQAANGGGCATAKGGCGKEEVTSDLQDILIFQLKGIGQYSSRLHKLGKADAAADSFTLGAIFATLTNVNFNAARFVDLIAEAVRVRDRVRAAYEAAAPDAEKLEGPAAFEPADSRAGLIGQAPIASVRAGVDTIGEDIVGLRALVLYGLKGVAAYAHHAEVLGKTQEAVSAGVAHTLDFLATNSTDIDVLLNEALALGKLNYLVMELLDAANTGAFGTPVPTGVRTSPIAGKAILVSGHDLRDLHAILEATKGTGINVYTHGELLPAHAYPKLQEYSHLAGNYGTAWQNQQLEFASFPGPIVMTSNCLMEPQAMYRNRLFTTGPAGWPGVRHIANGDYSIVLQAAKALPGFAETSPENKILIGFAHQSVLSVADKVIDAVKGGAIKHFFLIGGCDGAAPGRNYYTEFAEQAPNDTVLLTLGCGKYRFNKQSFGTIGGLPRLLDIGQCNDTYSAVQIALALANAFKCGVNDLPLSLVVSWFEQKALAVLLTLLALGIRNVKLGPRMPAFLTPTLLNVLVEKFGVQPITTAEADIAACLSRSAA